MRQLNPLLFLCSLLVLAAGSFAYAAEKDPETAFTERQLEFFEKKIRPVFVEHCHECHSGEEREGGLLVTSRAALLKGGDTGPAVVPGKVDQGELLAALSYDPDGYQMPPAGKLSDQIIADLRTWVEQGAAWPAGDESNNATGREFNLAERAQHWSFQPLTRPEVPSVSNSDWCRSPIDAFLLSKLEPAKLAPAGAADRRTWLRRVSFDVTGLPPSPEELAAFLADDQPGAHQRVIDRLLNSPHFGERWARHWLDLVRYAESRGHEFDFDVANPWHYRDYVIRALNADVPYDQFVAEHLAGDLLPAAASIPSPSASGRRELVRRIDSETGRNESILGTGFWFLGEWVHSPVDIRQEEANRFDNMIDVYSRTFLALTVACARCHDHKFDPILQRDFYAMQSFLQSSTYRQARFESMEHNENVAEQLTALRAEAGPVLLKAFAELIEPTVNDADKYFLAAQSVLEAGITLKKTAADQVFADFESGTYAGWTAAGDAFGAIPQTQQTIAEYQGQVKANGTWFVNSHQRRDSGPGDDAVGTLTSEPFVVERPYIQFLVGGGAHAGKTCVNLLVEDKVVRSTTGRNSNEMSPASWDVSDLRGQTARIQLVDNERGGWGNIGFDHVVFSDQSSSAEQQRRITPSDFAPKMQRQLVMTAQEYGVHVSTLSHWVAALASINDPSDFLSQFQQPQRPAAGNNPAAAGQTVSTVAASENSIQQQLDNLLERDDVRVIANYHSSPELLTDGPVFATGSRRGGEPLLTFHGRQPIAALADLGMIQRDRFWDKLTLAPGTKGDPGGTENWQRAGRMLRTPSFEITQPKVFALVKGGVHTYACVDSHITIRGPLHGSLLRNHSHRDDWHWIEHDVNRYQGHRAHLEFIPQGEDDFAVALVVQAASGLPPLELGNGEFATSDPSRAPAQKLRILLEAAVHLMYGDHTVSADEPHIIRAANWLLSHPGVSGLDDSNLKRWQQLAEPYAQHWNELQSQVQTTSSTAPAWMQGTDENEYVFIRGNWKKHGEDAPRQFLEVFHRTEGEAGRATNRLELARQVVDPQRTPITARVIVNRIWQHYFGRGIVSTPDDFGHLGQAPSHPELLDWLATELIAHDWSLKHIHRLILNSSAYRMSSRSVSDAHVLEVDPNNVLLHRMNLKRLEGEIIRDAILSLSGRLDPTLYGPSIPIHLTPFLEGRGRPASGPVDGAGRRSIYLSVRRNFPEPFFQAFDFPNPHTTIGRRSVSNVPSQALALMNNEMVIDQARKWAGELLRSEQSDEARLNTLYRSALCRLPTAEETTRAQQFLTAQAEEYQTTPSDERVWADLCQIIWNTKEFVFVQ